MNKPLKKGDFVKVRPVFYHDFVADHEYLVVDFSTLGAVYLEDEFGNQQALMPQDIIAVSRRGRSS